MQQICGTCQHYRGGYRNRMCSHRRLDDYSDILPIAATVHVRKTRPEEGEGCELWERRPGNREYEAEVA